MAEHAPKCLNMSSCAAGLKGPNLTRLSVRTTAYLQTHAIEQSHQECDSFYLRLTRETPRAEREALGYADVAFDRRAGIRQPADSLTGCC